jgi:hypothetical protein|tara:strand:+ start:484 stop:1365 length:882 start_codon:yes stop_codon:yes gene_type:complete
MTFSAREASKLFTSTKLSALADGDFSYVTRVAQQYLGVDHISDIKDIFNLVHKKLSQEYRSEYYFKNAIAKRHLLGKHSLSTATMLSEFRVGRSKADCVIVNGKSTCYEIKSEFDTLNRLNTQLIDYLKVFDEVYVVCANKNVASVLENSDPRVGVLVLTSKNYLSEKRTPTPRKEPIDIEILMKSLRKAEYLDIVESMGLPVPDVPNSRLQSECESLLTSVDPKKLSKAFLNVIKKTRRNDGDLIKSLPNSLVNAAISYQFSNGQINALKRIFNNDMEKICITPSYEASNLN